MTGINDHMKIGRHGLLLIASSEGKPRLKARRCEGGKHELSYGCTTWPDGRPIGAADFCNEDQALQLFAFHLHRFEAVVESNIHVPLNQFQYDAHVSLAYNIGPDAYAKSSVVRLTNEKKWGEAAEAFGKFVFATSSGPSETQQKMARHKGQWRINAKKQAVWIGQDGTDCTWVQGLLGLEIRHYCEGLLSLGLPWEVACNADNTFLDTERQWDAGQRRWEDAVMDRTPFSAVKARAEAQVLADPTAKLTLEDAPAPGVNAPFNLDEYEKRVDAATKAPAPAAPPPVASVKPAPGPVIAAPPPKTAPTPLPAPPRPIPAPAPPPAPMPKLEYEVPKGSVTPHIPAPAKPMENTRRFWGAFLFYGGKIIMAVGVTTLPGKFAVAFGEAYGVFVKDPVLFGLAIDFLTVCSGWTMDHCGAWMRKWGERRATRPMVSGGERDQLAGPTSQTSVVSTQSLTVSTVGGP